MPDDQKMNLTMARATEKAIKLLIASQQAAEEVYLSEPDPPMKILERKESSKGAQEE